MIRLLTTKRTIHRFMQENTNRSASFAQKIKNSLSMPVSLLALYFVFVTPCFSWLQDGPQGDGRLDAALRKMEAAGKNFRSFAAKFTWKKYTAILEEFDTPENGEFYYSRAKDGSALIRQVVTSPGNRILTIKNGVVTIYQRDIQQAKIAHLGKDKDKAEYLALGIGQSPAKLQETFDISYLGRESVNGSACLVLLFKPKKPGSSALYSSTTVWIKESNGIPVQHKFLEPSGDYLLSSFFNEKLNAGIDDSMFEQTLPRGVEILRIQ